MSGLSLYFLLKLTSIGQMLLTFGSLILLFIILSIPCVGFYCDNEQINWWKTYKKFRPFSIGFVGVFLIVLGVMLPTTKQMAVIYVYPKVSNSHFIQTVPQKILNLSEEWLEELRPKNKEGKNTSDNKQRAKTVSSQSK